MRPLGNGVVAAGMKGMTTEDPAKSEPASAQDSVTRDRFLSEVRTRGFETTRRSKEGVNHDPIKKEEPTQEYSRTLRTFSSNGLHNSPGVISRRADARFSVVSKAAHPVPRGKDLRRNAGQSRRDRDLWENRAGESETNCGSSA
jgi:hypothetical protein